MATLTAYLEPEDALRMAVADFLRDHKRSASRLDAAQRVNHYAAALGISPRVALETYSKVAA